MGLLLLCYGNRKMSLYSLKGRSSLALISFSCWPGLGACAHAYITITLLGFGDLF